MLRMLVTATSIRYEIAAPSTISCIDGGSISCEEDGDWTAYFSLHTGDTTGEFGGHELHSTASGIYIYT
jgi:hypothetical protein